MWLTKFGQTGDTVFYIFVAVAIINLILALAILIAGCCLHTNVPGYSMDINIVLGGLALVVSVVLNGIQPDWMDTDTLTAICQVHPAVVTIGLLWFIGGLLMKVSAIFHFYRCHSEGKTSPSEVLPQLWLLVIMLIDAAVVLLWTLMYHPRLFNSASEPAVQLCEGQDNGRFQLAVSAFHAVLLIVAFIINWAALTKASHTYPPYEVTLVCVITSNTLLVTVFGAVFYFFGSVNFSEEVISVTVGGLINYAVCSAFLMLLVGKVSSAGSKRTLAEEPFDWNFKV